MDFRIVGIVLVRNEDLHLRQVVSNILAFCDQIFLVDNQSADGTPEIARDLASAHPEKITFHSVQHPRESHEFVRTLAGQNCWIFAVDGDEIYDPTGLAALRPRLERGEFTEAWMVVGNVLHVSRLAPEMVSGYLSPPSRSITKLYNFAAIDAWDGDTPERLHGGRIVFRTGFGHASKRNLHQEMAWEDSPLRCLHLCFLPRSSADASASAVRPNIMELHSERLPGRMWRAVRHFLRLPQSATWKDNFYRRGEEVTVDAAPFFP